MSKAVQIQNTIPVINCKKREGNQWIREGRWVSFIERLKLENQPKSTRSAGRLFQRFTTRSAKKLHLTELIQNTMQNIKCKNENWQIWQIPGSRNLCIPGRHSSLTVFLFVSATMAPINKSVCVVTLDAYKAVHGEEPTSVGGLRSTFGWTEKDGLVENFPTDDSEKVFYGDSVLVHDEVHINPCYTWYVYTHRQTDERLIASPVSNNCVLSNVKCQCQYQCQMWIYIAHCRTKPLMRWTH